MNTRFAILPIATLALTLTACSGTVSEEPSATATTHVKTSIGAVVTVPADLVATDAAEDGMCVPTAEFTEITDGTPVAITDADGDVLAESVLTRYSTQSDNCALNFFISSVARDKGTYTIVINGEDAATFAEDEFFAGGERRFALNK